MTKCDVCGKMTTDYGYVTVAGGSKAVCSDCGKRGDAANKAIIILNRMAAAAEQVKKQAINDEEWSIAAEKQAYIDGLRMGVEVISINKEEETK